MQPGKARSVGTLVNAAVRGAVGINGAGSGAVDFSSAVMSLCQNTVPPSVNTDDLDPACKFQFVQDEPVDANITQAITVAYALAGGQNAALVIRKYQK